MQPYSHGNPTGRIRRERDARTGAYGAGSDFDVALVRC
jgi:hypothetical protein